MQLKGKIIQVLDLQTGEGANGQWKKQEYVLETTDSKYPKKVVFSLWKDKIDEFNLSEGQDVDVSIEIESREFNGRWYTNVQAWRLNSASNSDNTVQDQAPSNDQIGEEQDDLPF